MKTINPPRHTYGPTKYSWAIENRLDEISNKRLFKSIKRKLGSMYQEFCTYFKHIEYIPEQSKAYFKYALYNEFYFRVMKSKSLASVDFGIRENFIKVFKEKIKE